MGREAAHPLTAEEAKARLLEAAAEAGPVAWTREHPLPGVAVALLAGVAASASPDARRALLDALALFLREV